MIRKKFKKAKKDYNKKCDGQQQTQQIQIPFFVFLLNLFLNKIMRDYEKTG